MLLFKKPFWEGLTGGAITLTFRRWQKPHVKAGGRYRCHPIGVLEVDDVRRVRVASITDAEAERAGFSSRDALLTHLSELGALAEDTDVWRVALHHGGDGDRVGLALEDNLTETDVADLTAKLARLDAGDHGAWTAETLAIIDERPRIAASRLAEQLGRETAPFKEDVRKLKKLGLTQSFEVGYEIAPRGRAYLARAASAPRAKSDRTVRGSAASRAPSPRGRGETAAPKRKAATKRRSPR
jgi:hypothetical protein